MNAIVDLSKFQGLEQDMSSLMERVDEALLHFSGASALLLVLQNSIDALIVKNDEKASMVDAVLCLISDAVCCVESVKTLDLSATRSMIKQIEVYLNCLKCAFMSEADCPSDRLQTESLHALRYLLDKASLHLEGAHNKA